MRKIPVSSSTIDSVGYDRETQKLYVDFITGGRYVYIGVPIELFVDLINAHSVGAFHALRIKEAFSFQRLED